MHTNVATAILEQIKVSVNQFLALESYSDFSVFYIVIFCLCSFNVFLRRSVIVCGIAFC